MGRRLLRRPIQRLAFEGYGSYSDYAIEPSSWWVEPTTAQEITHLVMAFERSVRLSHVGLRCDNYWLNNKGGLPIDIEYSHDGNYWLALPDQGYISSHLTRETTSPVADYFWCAIWLPPAHTVRAKYWKIKPLSSEFSSDYGDNLWHITQVNPGAIDEVLPRSSRPIRYMGNKNEIYAIRDDATSSCSWVIAVTGRTTGYSTRYIWGTFAGQEIGWEFDEQQMMRERSQWASNPDTGHWLRDSIGWKTATGIINGGFGGTTMDIASAASFYGTPDLLGEFFYGLVFLDDLESGLAAFKIDYERNKTISFPDRLPDARLVLFLSNRNTQSTPPYLLGVAFPTDQTAIYTSSIKYIIERDDGRVNTDMGIDTNGVTALLIDESMDGVEYGSYAGDGSTNRIIPLSKANRPRVIIIGYVSGGSKLDYTMEPLAGSVTRNPDHFVLSSSALNASGVQYHWVALS